MRLVDASPVEPNVNLRKTLTASPLFVWREGRDASGAPIDIRNFRIAKDDFAAIQDAVLAALNISRP